MAIKSYSENGKIFYEVYVNYRSKTNPSLRCQKRKNGIDSKGKAERLEKELFAKCIEVVKAKENTGFLWGEIVEKWKLYESHNSLNPIAEDTLEDYFSSLEKWTSILWRRPITELTKGHIREVIGHLNAQGKSNSYQNKVKLIINKVINWAIDEGLVPDGLQKLTSGIRIARLEEKTPEILNLQEVKKLLDAARSLEHPWYPVWAMACLTGMRSGELFALEWSDVDLESNRILVSKSFNKRKKAIKSTKAGYYRIIPINEDLRFLLLELRSKSKGGKSDLNETSVLPRIKDWYNGQQAKVLRTFCLSIGLKSIKFHTLRACFATHLLGNKVAPASVMKICGWKDLETMARYIRLAGIEEKGATDCLQLLGPVETMNKFVNLVDFKAGR